jgi:pyridoxine kinase
LDFGFVGIWMLLFLGTVLLSAGLFQVVLINTPDRYHLLAHHLPPDVGNKSAVFPLQLLGFDVDVINSVHFSNHTGYPQGWEGDVLAGNQLRAILQGLQRNQLLDDTGHVLTGYIGSESFLEAVLEVVQALRALPTSRGERVRFVCDPVLGDRGEFYVPRELVGLYREKVLPLADVVTPNEVRASCLCSLCKK